MNKEFNNKRYNKDFFVDFERVDKIISLVGQGGKVLDIGCGDGQISKIIKENNEVFGIEISDIARQKAKDNGINVLDLDLNLNWSDGLEESFDVVVAGEIIEHIFDTDKFLQNIHKVLKEDGYLVLSTPNIASLGRRLFLLFGINPAIETTARSYDAGHIRYFTFNSLKKMLKENNFKVISFTSDCINFDRNGLIKNIFLVNIFPKTGRSLIIKAIKQ
jgi:methionine biosynthesis protein MetW